MKLPKHIRQYRDSFHKKNRNEIYEKSLSKKTEKLLNYQKQLEELGSRNNRNKKEYDRLTTNIYYLENSCANLEQRIEKNLQCIF